MTEVKGFLPGIHPGGCFRASTGTDSFSIGTDVRYDDGDFLEAIFGADNAFTPSIDININNTTMTITNVTSPNLKKEHLLNCL